MLLLIAIIVSVILVIGYIFQANPKIPISVQNQSLFVISLVAVFWKLYGARLGALESFAEPSASAAPQGTLKEALATMEPISIQENINVISKNLIHYYTAFNIESYKKGNLYWKCLVNPASLLQFSDVPTFTPASGISLGPIRIQGPLSHTMGIVYNNPFTMTLAFRHGNIRSAIEKTNMEILKLYANSPNNNALKLYIDGNSIKIVNNIQFGKLMFQLADYEPVPCKISPADEYISMAENTLCILSLVRSEDSLRILYATEKDQVMKEVAKLNVAASDITFSNKEMYFNRSRNWNASLYTFALHNVALGDVDVSVLFEHIKSLHAKFNDPHYRPMVAKYNRTLSKLSSYVNCPFDEDVCRKCKGVSEWNDVTQLLNAPKECGIAINDFCKKNTTHPMCQCWNASSTLYSSKGCKMLRDIMGSDKQTFSYLTPEDIEYLKVKYGLTDAKACAKAKQKLRTILLDTDANNKYTFDKVRIKYGDPLETVTSTSTSTSKSLAPAPVPTSTATLPEQSKASNWLLKLFGY